MTMWKKGIAVKAEINGRPVPYGFSKEELYALLNSDNMTDFLLACEALSVIHDEETCDRMGSYLSHPDMYRRLAVLKVIFRNPYAVKYKSVLEEAISSEQLLFAGNGLRVAYECRVPVSETVILAAIRRHMEKLFSPDALELLAVNQENYQVLTEMYSMCVTSLQQEVVTDILVCKYADTHADELFALFSRSPYSSVRCSAAFLGRSYGFDLTALQQDRDGHVRKAALG